MRILRRTAIAVVLLTVIVPAAFVALAARRERDVAADTAPPGGRWVELLPDVGHIPQLEDPEAFNALLVRVLRGPSQVGARDRRGAGRT